MRAMVVLCTGDGYELAEGDADMQALMRLLKMHPIPSDEVHLKPDLLLK